VRILLYLLPLCLLCAGLLGLHGIFVRERDESLQALHDRHRALIRSAQESLRLRLGARLQAARGELAAVLEDPLGDDRPFLLLQGRLQVLPRVRGPRAAEAPEGEARALYTRLVAGGPRAALEAEPADAPFAERLRRMDRFLVAMHAGDSRAMEQHFRALLAHRALYQVAAARDAAAMLWLLERFAATGKADPELMRALLREGLQGDNGARLTGLQRQLLLRRDDLSDSDLGLLAPRLVALSEQVGVEARDFAARVTSPPAGRVPLELPLQSPMVAYGYYVEPDGPGGAVGVKVDLAWALEEVSEELRALGLLEAEDTLGLDVPQGPGAVHLLPIGRSSPSMEQARARVLQRHALKSGLLLGSAVLGLGFIGFAGLAHARKRRLVAVRAELLATVSHELRTPLSAIRVMAETLERRAAGAPGVDDYPARIVGEADALGRLVENILVFNRLEKGKVEAHLQEVPLREVLEGVADEVRCSARVGLRLDASGVGEARVKADPALLRILLSNLLHNAHRHCGKDEVTVTAQAGLSGEWMTLRLGDDGPGIPRDSWETIFGEFERLAPTGAPAQGGSGLGLAICRRIMRLHRGELRVAASGPEGTTFELGFVP
jgi:two-component system sensor histidine kinase SenX3